MTSEDNETHFRNFPAIMPRDREPKAKSPTKTPADEQASEDLFTEISQNGEPAAKQHLVSHHQSPPVW